MTRYHNGARRLEGSITAYAKRFDFLEIHMQARGRPAPTSATFRRWRKQVPPHFDFSVVLGPVASTLKAGSALDAEIDGALAGADALQARCMLVATPPEVTPAPIWRDRLATVIARLTRDATQVAWEPRGVWEIDDAQRLAQKLGVLLVVDPLRDAPPPGPTFYGRLRAMGETRSYGTSALERVVATIGVRRDVYVVIETASALTECKRLRTILQGGSSKTGGTARVVRPRDAGAPTLSGSLRVKDDEQE